MPYSGALVSTNSPAAAAYAAAKADGGVAQIFNHYCNIGETGADGADGAAGCTWAEFRAFWDAVAADVAAGTVLPARMDEILDGSWRSRVPAHMSLTLTGDLVLSGLPAPRRDLYLDANGAGRSVTLRGMTDPGVVTVTNTAAGDFALTIQNVDGGTLVVDSVAHAAKTNRAVLRWNQGTARWNKLGLYTSA